LETPISTCGTQIWRGACLLADYLLNTPEVVRQKQVLELGSGTGLVGVVAAGAAGSSVILTDVCKAALSLACQNAAANLPTWQQRPGPYPSCKGSIVCRQLDWSRFLHTDGSSLTDAELLELLNSQQLGPQQYTDAAEEEAKEPTAAAAAEAAAEAGSLIENSSQHTRSAPPDAGAVHGAPPASSDTWAWQVEDLQQLRHVDVLLAADVVYEPVLTEAFVHTAHALMSWMQKEQACQQPAGAATASGQTAEDTQPHAQQPRPHTHQGQVPVKGPILYVAAEKRYNFTLRDMDAVATAWDHFMSFVTPANSSSCQRGGAQERGHTSGGKEPAPALFMGEPVDWRALPQVGVCTSECCGCDPPPCALLCFKSLV
jgi:predicted nicotinamide N-methyase